MIDSFEMSDIYDGFDVYDEAALEGGSDIYDGNDVYDEAAIEGGFRFPDYMDASHISQDYLMDLAASVVSKLPYAVLKTMPRMVEKQGENNVAVALGANYMRDSLIADLMNRKSSLGQVQYATEREAVSGLLRRLMTIMTPEQRKCYRSLQRKLHPAGSWNQQEANVYFAAPNAVYSATPLLKGLKRLSYHGIPPAFAERAQRAKNMTQAERQAFAAKMREARNRARIARGQAPLASGPRVKRTAAKRKVSDVPIVMPRRKTGSYRSPDNVFSRADHMRTAIPIVMPSAVKKRKRAAAPAPYGVPNPPDPETLARLPNALDFL